jgi:hypothetical protein
LPRRPYRSLAGGRGRAGNSLHPTASNDSGRVSGTSRRPDDAELKLALADLHELVCSYDDGLQLYDEVRRTTNDVRAWCGRAAVYRERGESSRRSERSTQRSRRPRSVKDLAPLWLEAGWTLSVSGRVEQAPDVQRRHSSRPPAAAVPWSGASCCS